MRLTSLDEMLQPFLAVISPVPPVSVLIEHAVGLPLAEAIVAPAPVPSRPVALRAGLAVCALDLVGASNHSPVMLRERPHMVSAGEYLPPGCDAILDPAAIEICGASIEVTETAEPGAHVRLAGHDLADGQLVAAAGTTLTVEMALVASLAGIRTIKARRPTIQLDWPDGPERDWLSHRLRALGLSRQMDDGAADLVILPTMHNAPQLALRPGETAWASIDDEFLQVELPKRFDGMVGCWCAVILPLLVKLMGVVPAVQPLTLNRKIVSTVGMTEVALLKREGDNVRPLGVSDLTLASIANADSFAILPAGSEGIAGGDVIDAISLEWPFQGGGSER